MSIVLEEQCVIYVYILTCTLALTSFRRIKLIVNIDTSLAT